MSSVEEIKDAIDRLGPDEFRLVARWVRERERQRWDEQLDRDSVSSKLDLLFREADEESRDGLLLDWPPMK